MVTMRQYTPEFRQSGINLVLGSPPQRKGTWILERICCAISMLTNKIWRMRSPPLIAWWKPRKPAFNCQKGKVGAWKFCQFWLNQSQCAGGNVRCAGFTGHNSVHGGQRQTIAGGRKNTNSGRCHRHGFIVDSRRVWNARVANVGANRQGERDSKKCSSADGSVDALTVPAAKIPDVAP